MWPLYLYPTNTYLFAGFDLVKTAENFPAFRSEQRKCFIYSDLHSCIGPVVQTH